VAVSYKGGGPDGSGVAITLRPVNEAEEIEQLDELAEEVRITRLGPVPGSLPGPPARRAALPARTAAAVAAGGFVAGAAALGMAGRRQRRSKALAKGPRRAGLLERSLRRGAAGRRGAAPAERLQIIETRKLLIDVHLLGSPGPDH